MAVFFNAYRTKVNGKDIKSSIGTALYSGGKPANKAIRTISIQ